MIFMCAYRYIDFNLNEKKKKKKMEKGPIVNMVMLCIVQCPYHNMVRHPSRPVHFPVHNFIYRIREVRQRKSKHLSSLVVMIRTSLKNCCFFSRCLRLISDQWSLITDGRVAQRYKYCCHYLLHCMYFKCVFS